MGRPCVFRFNLYPRELPKRTRLAPPSHQNLIVCSRRAIKWISSPKAMLSTTTSFLHRAFVTKHAHRYEVQLLEDVPLEV